MSDKLDRLVAERVMGWKWWKAVPCEWFDGHGRDCLLAHCLRQNASFLLSPEQSNTSDLMKESDGNGMTVMHPKFRPMEGVCNRWGKPKPFSTDIAAAWEVVEHLRKQTKDDGTRKYLVSVVDHVGHVEVQIESVCMEDYYGCDVPHGQEPRGICLAALRAVGVPESKIQEAM